MVCVEGPAIAEGAADTEGEGKVLVIAQVMGRTDVEGPAITGVTRMAGNMGRKGRPAILRTAVDADGDGTGLVMVEVAGVFLISCGTFGCGRETGIFMSDLPFKTFVPAVLGVSTYFIS